MFAFDPIRSLLEYSPALLPNLFSPLDAGALQLPNRVVMAPLTRCRAKDAIPNAMMARYYAQRASAGLIVSEGIAISHQAQGFFDVPGLYAPEQVQGWRAVTRAVHAAGGRIVAQLWHVGRASHVSLQPGGGAPIAPTAMQSGARAFLIDAEGVPGYVPGSMPRALSIEEIPAVAGDFARAARAAIEAGFDGVEIHAANGYLIDQFLRSSSNHRNDAYGGAIQNRVRFLADVVAAVTATIGAERVAIRLSPVTPSNDVSDPQPQALFEAVMRCLALYQLAYVHVIEGATGGARDFKPNDTHIDYAALKTVYRMAGGTGAWIGNNGYNNGLAQAAIAAGQFDAIAFGRDFIANPNLVDRLRDDTPLAEPDRSRFYGGGEQGYTDYPRLG